MTLKPISKSGIARALAKAEMYRYVNEPGEAESICRDVLAADPENQAALALLGLALADQFCGTVSDRCAEAGRIIQSLKDPYERLYYTGLLNERRAKAQIHAGRPPHVLAPLLENAMACFEKAEKIRPEGNDDAILRWNRCARLLEGLHEVQPEPAPGIEIADGAPVG
jgi:tetratricopeptide (TPR) repeat protein